MFVVTVDLVEQHLAELRADADRARLARRAHPAHPGHNAFAELVGSLVTSARATLEPAFPTPHTPASRG